MVAKPWFQRTILQEGLWNLSFFVDKDSILTKVWIFKICLDIEMITAWTSIRSYRGHFERSQTPILILSFQIHNFYFLCILFLTNSISSRNSTVRPNNIHKIKFVTAKTRIPSKTKIMKFIRKFRICNPI